MKTSEETKQEILSWVRGADRYNQNLDSHLEYAANEIMKITKEYAKQWVDEVRRELNNDSDSYDENMEMLEELKKQIDLQ